MTDWAKNWSKIWFTMEPGSFLYQADAGIVTNKFLSTLYYAKEMLTREGVGAWTVLASSGKAGGVSLLANTNDNWLSVDDLVFASNSTSDRSWTLLKSPDRRAGCFYLVLDYWSASDASYVNWYFTKSQPDISSPATNARPPATGYEWSHMNQRILRDPGSGCAGVSTFGVRAHDGSFVLAASSPKSYEFRVWDHMAIFNVLRTPKPWDATGAVSLIRSSVDKAYDYSTLQFQSLHSDGTQVTVEPVQLRAPHTDGTLYASTTDAMRGRILTMPVPMISTTTGYKTFRGELEDLYFLGRACGDGEILFDNEFPKAIRVGPFAVPCDRVRGMT